MWVGQGRAEQSGAGGGQGKAGQGRAKQGRSRQGRAGPCIFWGSKGIRQDYPPVGVEGEHIEDDLDDGHRNPNWHEQCNHLVAPRMCTVKQPHD